MRKYLETQIKQIENAIQQCPSSYENAQAYLHGQKTAYDKIREHYMPLRTRLEKLFNAIKQVNIKTYLLKGQ